MLYVGVDAHKSTSQITVMNQTGVILRRKRIPSTCEGFQEALAGYSEPLKSVLEANYSWGPTYNGLDELSEEVLLAHPLKVRAIASARRTLTGPPSQNLWLKPLPTSDHKIRRFGCCWTALSQLPR